ncbi:MAG: tetratricopeptide repeat protein [Myxococcales bacterium]
MAPAWLALTLALSVTPAQRLEAERLARQSITDYNVGDFASALREATSAYKLDPRPALLFNLGQVHRALHNWERAEFFFRGYLRERPQAPNRAAVEQLIAEMQAKQKESPRPAPAPTIAVTPLPKAPPPAPAAAPPPAPRPAVPEQVPLVIENRPEQPPPPPAAPPPAAPILTPPPPEQPRSFTAAEVGGSSVEQPPTVASRSHTAAYVIGGVALAAAGVGVAAWLESYSYQQWYDNVNAKPGQYGYASRPMGPDQAKTWAISAYVLGGVAAAGLIGAIIAW